MKSPAVRGRPALYSDDLAVEICERMSHGEPLARICDDPRMPSFMTVYRWEKNNPAFCEISARAREIGSHFIADDCLQIADDPELDPNDKRVRIDTRLRLIGKWNRKDYGDLKRVEMSGVDGGAIQVETHEVLDVSDMSAEERAVLREALERTRGMRAVNVKDIKDE